MQNLTTGFTQSISAYHAGRWKGIRKHLKDLLKNESAKNVHKARIEIKKIVALYEFMEFCDDRLNSKKELKPLNKIFKLLGKIRDYHNTIALCEKFDIDKDEFDKEKREQKTASKSVKALIEKCKDLLGKTEKANVPKLADTSSEQLKIYLEAEKKKIAAILDAQSTPDKLHHTRRDIKILVYDVELLDKAAAFIKPAEIETLDRLQDTIGKWHDLMIFRENLKEKKYKSRHPKKYAAIKKAEELQCAQINSPRDHAQTQTSSV